MLNDPHWRPPPLYVVNVSRALLASPCRSSLCRCCSPTPITYRRRYTITRNVTLDSNSQAMVSHGRVELLAHPLSQKYLQMKWNSYGKYFHLTNLLIYSIFLVFVTIFSSQIMQNDSRELLRAQPAVQAALQGQANGNQVICNPMSLNPNGTYM